MRAYSQKRRLFERYENVQNVECRQTRRNVFRAPGTGDDILRCHPRPPAKALLHIVDRRQIDHVEVAGPLTSLRQREGEYEEVVLRLKDMVGLPNGCYAAAVLEPLLKLSYVHVTPDASVYRESIFDLEAAEHHSLAIRSAATAARPKLPAEGASNCQAEAGYTMIGHNSKWQRHGRSPNRWNPIGRFNSAPGHHSNQVRSDGHRFTGDTFAAKGFSALSSRHGL
jgi:hypothetical protein